MAIRMRTKPIKAKLKHMDPKRHQRAIRYFLNAGAENVRIDLLTTVQTWKKAPRFTVSRPKGDQEDNYRIIGTRNKIYRFVSGGTRVRYATMSPDFAPKTRPMVIGSVPGSGRMLYVNKRKPRPGIQAREFPKAVIRKWEPRWMQLFLDMLQKSLSH